ncbi:hypothetical protein [Niallia sp. Krafla_26]|uniref:hypothetical protein n=1 Tax=Niallia sp. Krafla_26 TaxID=3064703 RepID=UPI003D184FF3
MRYIKQLRQKQAREFNTFCDQILAYDEVYSKPVKRKLKYYRQLFTALEGNDEFRRMAKDNLCRLTVIEIFVDSRNGETS